MIPVTQFILGNSDPLLYPSEKMTNSIDEQIAFLQSQKQAINEAYRRNAIPNANNGTTQNQQVPTQGIWDAIDAEIADKDGMIDIEGIFDEEMEVINNIDNFNFDISFIGGGNQNILDEFREFLDARGGRGGHGGRGGMRNRIGYDTYDTYGRSTNKNDREEKILTMLMSGGYNDDGYHFDGDKVWEYFHMNN